MFYRLWLFQWRLLCMIYAIFVLSHSIMLLLFIVIVWDSNETQHRNIINHMFRAQAGTSCMCITWRIICGLVHYFELYTLPVWGAPCSHPGRGRQMPRVWAATCWRVWICFLFSSCETAIGWIVLWFVRSGYHVWYCCRWYCLATEIACKRMQFSYT